MTNEEVLERIKSWLESNVEEQSLPFELRQDSARLRDKIQEWENE
jgi:antitoxin component of RelBE/YafQ-DinJ toxin-antitoxin module